MSYYVGIDGGGSKTELIIGETGGRIIKHVVGDSSNSSSIGIIKARESITGILAYALGSIGAEEIGFISVCIPGIKDYWKDIELFGELANKGRALITGDEDNSFYGALVKDQGIVILSGTGSFATGINSKGDKLTVGGWGPLLGDEGSGYYMGIKAIKAAISRYEASGSDTVLFGEVMECFGINDIDLLKSVVYKNGLQTRKIASLGKAVLKGARAGDKVCLDIISESAEQLYKMAETIIRRLKMTDIGYELCLTGGISCFGDYMLAPLTNMVNAKYKNIKVVKPQFNPGVGSLILSYIKSGIELTDILKENLRTSYEGVELYVMQ